MTDKNKKQGNQGTEKGKQIMLRDLEGLLYLIPAAEAEKYRVDPESLPEVLECLAKELPDIDWDDRMRGKTRVPAAAVDVAISFGGSVAATEVVNKAHECCVADCCVVDCCVIDCGCVSDCSCVSDYQPPSHCSPIDGFGCRPVR